MPDQFLSSRFGEFVLDSDHVWFTEQCPELLCNRKIDKLLIFVECGPPGEREFAILDRHFREQRRFSDALLHAIYSSDTPKSLSNLAVLEITLNECDEACISLTVTAVVDGFDEDGIQVNITDFEKVEL